MSDQESRPEKGYVIEAIVSPEECFSILPLIRYVFLSLGFFIAPNTILRQGSLMARSRGSSSSPFYSEFFFLFVDGALEGTKGASEQ